MPGRFQFKLLTGSDPAAQYASIATKDSKTFYLLNTGVGYLGSQKLFDAGDTPISLATAITAQNQDSTTLGASISAIVDYVASQVSSSNILTTQFFRHVESHTLTSADMSNTHISKPAGAAEGDVGLLFTSDTDSTTDGDEEYYFISLSNYLTAVHSFGNTNSITMSVDGSNQVTASLKIDTTESELVVGAGGVKLNKVSTVNPTTPTTHLVTEDVMVNYLNTVLANYVQYTEDNGQSGA